LVLGFFLTEECVTYTNLTEADRNIKRGGTTPLKCDADLNLDNKWYRFAGDAGTRMLDYCPSVPCYTELSLWIDGKQPEIGKL